MTKARFSLGGAVLLTMWAVAGCSTKGSVKADGGSSPPLVSGTTDASGLVTLGSGADALTMFVLDGDSNRPVAGASVDASRMDGGFLVRVAKDDDAYQPELVYAAKGGSRTVILYAQTPSVRGRAVKAAVQTHEGEFLMQGGFDDIVAMSKREKRPTVLFLPALPSNQVAGGTFFIYKSVLPGTLVAIQTTDGRKPAEAQTVTGKGHAVGADGASRAGVRVGGKHVASAAVTKDTEMRTAPSAVVMRVPGKDTTGVGMVEFAVEDPDGRVTGFDVGLDTTRPGRRLPKTARSFMVEAKRGAHFSCVRPVFDGSDVEPEIACAPFDAPMAPPAADVRVGVKVGEAALGKRARMAFPIDVDVENTGDQDTGGFDVSLAISRDGSLESGLGELSNLHIDGLGAKGKVTRRASVRSSRDGTFFVVAAANAKKTVAEANSDDDRAHTPVVSAPSGMNHAPVLAMLGALPPSGGALAMGKTLHLSAFADDREDGDLSGQVVWRSLKDGVLGKGGTLDVSSLSPGVHHIRAEIVDSGTMAATLPAPRGKRHGRGQVRPLAAASEPPSGDAAEIVLEVIDPAAAADSAPQASAGPDMTATVGAAPVSPLATASDPDGDALTFTWTLQTPAGSAATLMGAATLSPSLAPDVAGTYHLILDAFDGKVHVEDEMLVTALAAGDNHAPMAGLMLPASASAGDTVTGTGTASDPDGDGLTLSYALARPAGSAALVAGGDTLMPSFVPDVGGVYTLTLLVDDGLGGTAMAAASVRVAGGGGGGDGGNDGPVGLPDGASCAMGGDCASGSCVDGVCCETACAGACQACVSNKTGAADGQCRKVMTGTACGTGSCAGSSYTPAPTCDDSGACVQGAQADCGTMVCTTEGCSKSCTGEADCASGYYCAFGACYLKKAAGTACPSSAACAGGNCVDGVCCDAACTGACMACVRSKTGRPDGQCLPVIANTDPDNECTASATTTCGFDGFCDGAGACRKWAAGTTCGAVETCNGGIWTPKDTCDGAGTCKPTPAVTCAPYTCGGTSCTKTCSGPPECDSAAYCAGLGTCMAMKSQGAPCGGSGLECLTGYCIDGVCCESACDSTMCKSCSMAKTGMADGLCRKSSEGTSCGPTRCIRATFQPAPQCTTAGACVQMMKSSACLGGFACNTAGTDCVTSCGSDGDCASGHYCSGSSCMVQKTLGTGCTTANECSSGYCAVYDKVCCMSDCGTPCNKCDSTGTCGAIYSYQSDPAHGCPSPMTCSGNGYCM